MPDAQQFDIGASVVSEDGPCGELGRVVVDTTLRTITHLVVQPHDQPALGRLVPIELARVDGGVIRLRCTTERLREFDEVEDIEVRSVSDPWIGYAGDDVLAMPYFTPVSPIEVEEHVPAGEVAIQRGDRIHATDGTIGRVEALVVDAGAADRISHVLIQEGHLWGKKRVSIPATAIDRIDADGVHVSLTKHECGELPEVDVRPAAVRRDRG